MDDKNIAEKPRRRLNIALLTANTLHDRKRSSWGGTVDRIAQSLQKHCGEVYYIGSISPNKKLVGKVVHRLTRTLLKKNFLYNHTFALARAYARFANPKLAEQSYDVIIAPSGGTEIAFLETTTPIVLIEDANFALLHNYYAEYSNLLERSVRETNALEELAVKKAGLVLHPSAWAARSTVKNYHADPEKVCVVPFGANFTTPPPAEIAERRKRSDCCRLFFIGVDWVRKGGEIAFQTLLKLEELGIQAELIVLGCIPPPEFKHERMRAIAYLDKRDETQRKEMEELFETSDFLFLPTRNECYGMVFCEASAYGLPSISTDTGGVSGAVSEGENGFLLPLSAGGAEYAELIARIYGDEERYAELVRSSRATFEQRLNWDAWGRTVTRLIDEKLLSASSEASATLAAGLDRSS